MARSTNIASTVISIDMRHGAIHYYSMPKGGRTAAVHHVRGFVAPIFSEEFNLRFGEVLAEFAEAEPSAGVRRVALVLPDEAVALDHFRLPLMRSDRNLEKALDAKLATIYENREELCLNTAVVDKNKEYVTYAVGAMRQYILDGIRAVCAANRMLPIGVTTASEAVVAAVARLSPSLARESYLFLDIKDTYARFSFVVGGRVAGGYTLPFGLEFLRAGVYVPEDLLFDHTLGELTVLNAIERARSKKLTKLLDLRAGLIKEEDPESEDAEELLDEEDSIRNTLTKHLFKMPRRLPSYLQREIPEDVEGITRENFRVFVKWALSLLRTNPTVTALGLPKQVVVNLPPDLSYVLDALADEEKENGIPFVRFNGADASGELATALELMGGMKAGGKMLSVLRF